MLPTHSIPHTATDCLEAPTPLHALLMHAAAQPERHAIIFHADGEISGPTEHVSYAQLGQRAHALAARLNAASGAGPRGAAGERVLLLLPSGIDYLVGFFACAFAGALAVPAYPPGSSTHAQRIARIAADADARLVLTDRRGLARRDELNLSADDPLGRAHWLTTEAEPGEAPPAGDPLPSAGDVAFLQYTSGSTGDPRGVQVRHANLMHHARELRRRLNLRGDDVYVSWLPLFHDMGLIGMGLQALMQGAALVMMPPASFVQRPLRWLEAIHHHRGTFAFAPNFAFDLCTDAAAASPPQGLDLSCWRIAVNAAEPVHADTVQRFRRRFAPHGLSAETLVTGYGLAEATLLVSTTVRGAPVLAVDTQALEAGRLLPALPGTPAAPAPRSRQLPSTGVAEGGLIVDPDSGEALPEGRVGEVWIASPAVADGYWRRPEDTALAFQARLADGRGPFLRTGDLGALHRGELYIVGRLKDLIIVRGQNHHPSDLERSALAAHPALSRAAAFAVDGAREEGVVIVAEVKRTARRSVDGAQVVATLRAELAEQHGLALQALLLLQPAALPLTSSGKVQRRLCRQRFDQGGFDALFDWQDAAGAARGPAEPAAAPPAPAAPVIDAAALGALAPDEARLALGDLLYEVLAESLRWDAPRRAGQRAGFDTQSLAMLGLESMAAMELSRRVGDALGLELRVSDVLGGQTGAEVVALLQQQLALRQLLTQVAHAAPADDAADGAEVWVL